MDAGHGSPFKLSVKGEKFRSPVKNFPKETSENTSLKNKNITFVSKDAQNNFARLSEISKNLTFSKADKMSEDFKKDISPFLKLKDKTSLNSLKLLLKDQLFGTTFTGKQKGPLKQDLALFAQLRLGVLGKKFSNEQLLQAIKNAASVIWDLLKSVDDDDSEEDITADLLGILMDLHSSYTFAHSNRVTDLSMALASEIGISNKQEMANLKKAAFFKDIGQVGPDDLSNFPGQKNEEIKEYIEEIEITLKECSNLHDIGKMRIPEEILNKKGPLTEEEYKVIKDHPLIGVEIVSLFPHLSGIVPGIRHHHERWDGKGYPDGKKEEEIPLHARIITVTDCFDAMTSIRPYRKPFSYEQAINELIECAGTQFDPKLIPPFLYSLEKRREIKKGEYDDKIKKLKNNFNFKSERNEFHL